MTARMAEGRKAAFLKALGETGNQTLAAEHVCVSRSCVCQQRQRDAGFDAACRAAIEAAKARLGGGEGNRPGKGWGHLDGVELVVRGTGGSALRDAAGAAPQEERKGGKRVQIARARVGQWTAKREDRFLQVLSATCNAKAAYEAVGKSKGSAYSHRKRWPAFDRRWREAEAAGYDRLEDALLARGANLFSSEQVPPEGPMPAMTVAEAIQLMRLHQNQVRGIGKPAGKSWQRPRTMEEMRDSILRKLESIERRRRAREG